GTEGFHRQRVELAQGNPEFTAWGALGTGVRPDSIRRVQDRFLESALQRELPMLARFEVQADALSQAEITFGEPSDGGLTSQLDDFFAGFDDLASNPGDAGSREAVVRRGVALAQALGSARERLYAQQQEITAQIGYSLDQGNRLLREVQSLNRDILASQRGGVVPADLEDRRDQLIEQLGDMIGATGSVEGDGTATIRMGGRALVQLEAATEIEYDLTKLNGAPKVGDRELLANELDGRVGGLFEARDEHLASAIRKLDEFAADLAARVNDLHSSGVDMNGDDAVPFFVFVGLEGNSVDRAAAGLRVNPLITADPSLVAAGRDGSDGDNTLALDLAALRNDSSGPTGALRSLIVDFGSRARQAADLSEGQRVVVDSFRAQRESVSGVSLDEEGADLLRYQRSYQAAAQMIATADEMLQTLLAL
ncbi:MAG: flagellar hook-associated protein FlgK, partial [Gemmatimonadetes bacterium]|nr:flagellar hook-associated protein FlgK [Gemmatimonadota bacterium]